MLIEDLLPNINLEDGQTEFKGLIEEGKTADGMPKEDNWLKTLVGFANSQGGSLYVGVEDKTHKVLSLDHVAADKTIQMIHRLIKQKIVPSLPYDIAALPIKNEGEATRYVIEVKVSRSKNLPVGLKTRGLVAYYIRHFGATEACSQEELRSLFLSQSDIRYDEQPTEYVYNPDDFAKLDREYYKENNCHLTEKALQSMGFMDKGKHLSRGALMFKDDYHDDSNLIVATKWPGLDKGSDIVTATDTFNGNIIDAVAFCLAFVQSHSNNGYKKLPTGRTKYFSYPQRSVFEGVMNAICHRDYWINGSQIEINVFLDRLEITSPGSLVSGTRLQKEKNIGSIIPTRRNDVVCNVCRSINYIEKRGSGFTKIINDYSNFNPKYQPYITSTNAFFSLVLPDITYNALTTPEGETEIEIYVDGLLDDKFGEKILSLCYATPKTAAELASSLGLSASTYFRKNMLEPLIVKEYLIRTSGRPEKYTANKKKVFPKPRIE